jgi:ribosomal protein L7/L12
MKRIGFYALVVVVVISLLAEAWGIAIAVIVLIAVLFTIWIQNGHYRFLEIKDKLHFFNEMVTSDLVLINQLQEGSQKLIENIAKLEKEKAEIDPSDEKKLKQMEEVISCLKTISSMAKFYGERAAEMADIKHGMFALSLQTNYEQYLQENWLYYYRPSEDVLKPMYAEIKKVKSGTFFVRLEQVKESEKVYLIKVIKDTCKLNLRQAKDKVDAVRLGSMSVLIENIRESDANQIKSMLELWGGTAVVVDNKPVL